MHNWPEEVSTEGGKKEPGTSAVFDFALDRRFLSLVGTYTRRRDSIDAEYHRTLLG